MNITAYQRQLIKVAEVNREGQLAVWEAKSGEDHRVSNLLDNRSFYFAEEFIDQAVSVGHLELVEVTPGSVGKIEWLGARLTSAGHLAVAGCITDAAVESVMNRGAESTPEEEKSMGTKEALEHGFKHGAKTASAQELGEAVVAAVKQILGESYPKALGEGILAKLEPVLVVGAIHYAATNMDIPEKRRIARLCELAMEGHGHDIAKEYTSLLAGVLSPILAKLPEVDGEGLDYLND
jgi:hypothetical protein